MSPGWIGFIVGLIVGSFGSFLLLGLLVASVQPERERRIYEQARQDFAEQALERDYGGKDVGELANI